MRLRRSVASSRSRVATGDSGLQVKPKVMARSSSNIHAVSRLETSIASRLICPQVCKSVRSPINAVDAKYGRLENTQRVSKSELADHKAGLLQSVEEVES